ncbi:hypothetical protein [Nocardioides pantholopis]|uniref:hypothetical protein n=1 Tax=Nocardioides pantholopis TaxID=2483798 RepID=UPI000F0852C0|nr:hypothetical protein [Nocardioides pantholopis]
MSSSPPAPQPGDEPADLPAVYRLHPAVVARFVGAALVLLAVVMFAGTMVVAFANLTPDLLVLLLVVGIVAVFGLGWVLRSRAYVVRCDEDGYRVRMVRGAGATQARWTEVQDAVTTTRAGAPCVVLRLRDGRSTTIPVGVLALDREQFVRELQRHLQRGQGLRPL